MAPHISLWIVALGLNIGLATRLYFSEEPAANAEDPVLRLIEQPTRRPTLIVRHEPRDGASAYVFNIHLQGKNETVFLDV